MALDYYLTSLELQKKIYPNAESHPVIAMTYNNIGLAYNSLGNYKKAIESLEKSLEILKKVYGDEIAHPDIARILKK